MTPTVEIEKPTAPTAMERTVSPAYFRTEPEEAAFFERELRSFVPPDTFDAHVHLYNYNHLTSGLSGLAAGAAVGYDIFRQQQQGWMGDRAPTDGLFFAFPNRELDTDAANAFLHREIQGRPRSRGLLMIRPDADPEAVEAQVVAEGWAGFKVYHLFVPRPDTQNASIGEFLPEWAWDIAHRHELAIMLHQVRARSLADADNQRYINQFCRRYPGAKLIMAHAARGFCARHTVEGIDAIRGLGNVYFDTSAICEAAAFEAVLRAFGPTRLLYGSDFPISEARGRAISLGDSFHWIYEWDQETWPLGKPLPVGIESLLALRQACRTMAMNDSDIERIFKDNAREMLGLQAPARAEQALYEDAKKLIPGGTQLLSKRPEMFAPNAWPPYAREARGCEIITHDGRRLIDFSTNGIGSCLLGFARPEVVAAVQRRVLLGSMSTLNAPEEVELAKRLVALHPWSHNVRFARGGGEGLAIAIRIARAATGRDTVAFCGYHGWADWYIAANLSGGEALTGHLLPGLEPAGVPAALRGSALPFAYNDLDALERIASDANGSLAAVVMEPTRSAPPAPGFLEGIRALCDRTGARLIMDEVTSGFRLHQAGAHLKYGLEPDIAVYAKALGNGHPVGAIVGREGTMQAAQTSFISSTYWTEGVGAAAALATLDILESVDVPLHVEAIGNQVQDGLRSLAAECGAPLKVGGYPALTSLSFDHAEGAALLTLLTSRMLERGFLAGGGFYPTLAHTAEHVDLFLAAARPVLEELQLAAQQNDARERLGTPVKHGGFARLN